MTKKRMDFKEYVANLSEEDIEYIKSFKPNEYVHFPSMFMKASSVQEALALLGMLNRDIAIFTIDGLRAVKASDTEQ